MYDVLQPEALAGSAILDKLDADLRNSFLAKLTCEWMPGRRTSLLYHGAVDGDNPDAYHRTCGAHLQSPTLTLVRSEEGDVFGGVAALPADSGYEVAGGLWPFLFSVIGPRSRLSRFPLKPGEERSAFAMHPLNGPLFGGSTGTRDMAVTGGGGRYASCYTHVGRSYEDVLGLGTHSFTSDGNFAVADIEVWKVQ